MGEKDAENTLPGWKRRRLLMAGATGAIAIGTGALAFAPKTRASRDLVPDPNDILDVRPGYEYRIVARAGETMDDGLVARGNPDGMACVPHPNDVGKLVVVVNHELPSPHGGVSRVVIDAKTFAPISRNMILSGTDINCAGGYIPGHGWLSCEESDRPGFGFVYLCDIAANQLQPPQIKPGLGRFRHEAVAQDTRTGFLYLSEDNPDGCFYRLRPTEPANPFEGAFEAMRVLSKTSKDSVLDTATLPKGESFDVEWVPVVNPVQFGRGVATSALAAGASRVVRGEGVSYFNGSVYLCATQGGRNAAGQIFRYTDGKNGGTLWLVAESEDDDVLHMPDNITVAPWGDIIVAEDDGYGENFVRGVTPDGVVYDIAFNRASPQEVAGVCFSPDGRGLFVNLYGDGLTLVISRVDGQPWARPSNVT